MTDPITRLNAALEGRYRIEREIGEGGMATVYLAEDLRHERKVALKVLKPELAAVVGAERFLAEIKTTANLQHPHILPLFDSGQADGFLYYVMPFVEGESLRDKLDRERQLPIDQAVAIARAVASALDHAHRQGVIHRDIKPANILLHEGQPQVSDFGIALAVSAAGGNRLTETGLSLGTPYYMSPEQVTAERELDGRCDLYSLACVTYEMLAGEPPFTGPSSQAVVARILTEDPVSLRVRRRTVPEGTAAVVDQALEKLPADRFDTAGEFADALREGGTRRAASGSRRVSGKQPLPWLVPALIVALVASSAVGAIGWLDRAPLDEPGQLSRLTLSLNGDHRLALADFEALPLAVSPDGRHVAYVGESATGTQLYLRPLGSFEAIPLQGTGEARQPFFSPDGEWVAYFTSTGLFRASASGGAPILVTPLPPSSVPQVALQPSGGTWGAADIIVFSAGDDLWRVSLEGESAERIPIFRSVQGETGESESGDDGSYQGREAMGVGNGGWPSFLPERPGEGDDGPLVLTRLEGGELSAVSITNGSARLLGIQASGHGRYLSSGHIVYTLVTGVARAVPFDLASLEVTGPPVSVPDDVFRPNLTAATILAISDSGTLVYVPGALRRTLVLVDRGGGERTLPFSPGGYRFPSFSPDGEQIAVNRRDEGLMVLDLVTGAERRVSGGLVPAWSPQGDELAYDGPAGPERIGVAPGSPSEPIFEGPMPTYVQDWGEDGRLLLQEIRGLSETGTQSGVFIASLGASVPSVVIDSPYDERDSRRSPDGRLVSYTSDLSGRREVYIKGLAPGANPIPVSVNGGSSPIWSASGDELFFWRGEQVLAVEVTASDPPEVAIPVPLFNGRYVTNGPNWDVSPTGEFAMVSAGPNWLREILIVQNFFEELRQVVPGN